MWPNKYKNHKVKSADGIFDSKKEYKRWCDLKLLQRANKISNLQRQVSFLLLDKENGERAIKYVADFVYIENGKYIMEDVKSPITRKNSTYILKRKLVKHLYPKYEFREV